MNSTAKYMIEIKTQPGKPYQPYIGWDEVFATRKEAEECANRARKHDWQGVRVVKVRDGDGE